MWINKMQEIYTHFLENMFPERFKAFSKNLLYKEKCAFTK